MSTDRTTRLNELLRREIAEALYHVLDNDAVDLSAITVTRVSVTRDLREARVMVSIRGHEQERPRIMALLRRQRGEIQRRINRDLTIKYTPKLIFKVDESVERGDRILDLLSELESGTPAEDGPVSPESGQDCDRE